MAQNIYDDQSFFEAYSQLPRSLHGLDGAPEWPALRTMLPPLTGLRILDLGCGFGWFSRWAAGAGAASVLAIDLSEKVLTRAHSETRFANVVFERADLEALTLPPAAFDLVYSSLTLHYIEGLPALFATLSSAMSRKGKFVFSVEHPLFTAPSHPDWQSLPSGERVWPLDQYLFEGRRITDWLAPGVVKQHRTITTYMRLLLASDFHILDLEEWGPSSEQIKDHPEWYVELHRPPFLLISAERAPEDDG